MKYLMWRKRVGLIIAETFNSDPDSDSWEQWADWKEFYFSGHSPAQAAQLVYESRQ